MRQQINNECTEWYLVRATMKFHTIINILACKDIYCLKCFVRWLVIQCLSHFVILYRSVVHVHVCRVESLIYHDSDNITNAVPSL